MKKFISMFFSLCLALTLCLCVFSACTPEEPKGNVQIYMPDGAPALSMAKMLSEDNEEDGVEYHVVDASTINAYVTGEAPQADLCVLPLNLASKLLGSGENYQMLGAVTHGNLYILSTDTSVTFEDAEDLQALKGKTVGVIQIANVPGLTTKVVLNKYGVEWQELTGDVEVSSEKVNLQGIADPATGVTPAGGCDYYIAAEPLVSTKVAATTLEKVGDLQALYGGEEGYPQAVLVAKTEFIQSSAEWITEFINKMTDSATWLKTADTETVVAAVTAHLPDGQTPTFSAKNLSAEVIEGCSVRFVPAQECKTETVQFLNELIAVNPNAVSAVTDAFFYGA